MAAKTEKWQPGCGWGAHVESLTQLAAPDSDLWAAVLAGHVTQRAYPDESITLRCENGPWKGGSFRLYPGETELQLGPITYVATPPLSGAVKKTKSGISIEPDFCWHLRVKGSLDSIQAA